MPKTRKQPQTHHQKQEFNLLDWTFIVIGLITSIVAFFTNQGDPLIYTVASIIALNCAIIGTILNIKGYRSNFLFSLINALTYAFVAWSNQFYGSVAINLLFCAPLEIIGFYVWGQHRKKNHKVIARRLTPTQDIVVITVFIITTVLFNYALKTLGGNSTILDSSANILVIIAGTLKILRYREQWLFWFVSYVLQLVMWTSTGDITILVLRIFFPIGAIYGYINWRSLIKSSRKK